MLKFNFKKFAIFSLLGIMAMAAQAATEKYRVMFREDPSYSMVIGWSQVSGSPATVYYDVVDHGTDVSKYAFSKAVDRTATYRGMNNTFARLTGLTAKTKYYFIIVDQNSTSQRMWFETLPDNKFERLSIIAGGDSRNNRTPRQRANSLVAKLRPHFVMFGGDMIDVDNDAQWNDWMNDWQLTIAADGRMTPVLMTRGNHESSDRTIIDLFDIPTNNSAAYYAISVCDDLLRVYTLNTEISRAGDQYTWLKNDAETKGREAVWRYGQYHRPIIPHQSSKSILTDAIGTWSQTFYDERFQLVIDSDAHMVKQTYPIKPSTEAGNEKGHIRDDENGTIYMGEGCWGAPLRAADRINTWTQASGSFNSFNYIWVDYFKTEVRTINVDNEASVGSLTDANRFTLATNLNVFSPATGNVVTITNKNASKPVVEITNVLNGYIFENAGTVNINFTAEDELLGVDKVYIYINGQLEEEILVSNGQTTFSFALETKMGKSYAIEIVAENTSGLSSMDAKMISVGVGQVETRINTLENQASEILQTAFNNYITTTNFQHIQIGKIGDDYPVTGLRFSNVFIPQTAQIRSVKLEFTSTESATRIVDWHIRAEQNAESIEFEAGTKTGSGDVGARTLTQSVVNWRPTSWQVGEAYQTADLTELIEELRTADAYSPESPITFIITASGNGSRSAESFQSNPEKAPKLVIEYDFNPLAPQVINICEGNTAELSLGNTTYSMIVWSHDANLSDATIQVSETGVYKATVTDELGYKGWVEFAVNVSELPVVNLGSDTTLVDIASYIIDAGEHHRYLWSTGASTRTITVTEDGNYSVEVSNESGCSSSDEISVAFTSNSSVNQVSTYKISMYPNPVSCSAINVSGNPIGTNYKVISMEGKILLQGALEVNGSVWLENLSAGIYFFIIANSEGVLYTEKFVKE
jgi:hypothetical protein